MGSERLPLRVWARRSGLKAWLYLLPALLILGVFQIYPVFKSFLMGFYTKFDYLTDTVYEWGLDNFVNLLHDADFALAIQNTCILVVLAAPLSIAVSLVFAVLLNSNIRLRRVFQSIYFLPFVTSMVAVSIAWSWMLNKDFGLVNSVLKLFGISKVAWLTTPDMTIPILVVLAVWKGLGYRVIILLAGLQGIDRRYYAAARVDGARGLSRFFHITIPMLKPTLVFLSITTVIDVFKTFDEVYVMYSNDPGPLKSGLTIVYYIFTKFYRHWEFASAAAASFVLFLMIFAITLLQFLFTSRSRREGRR
ncbi:ABC transporter permease [Flavonifractor sp. An92]|uniref:carbohydrate ABC transporter permease n=1 Tax=Flavonifractor sp. An92 TaxID=1965666 RepID=UPI000B3822A4|nr:sugar ABC transporter permease [Flavonifractor sp. An92]OUN08141.1 ABC transporter permease [Flavonifractor sp. An92]